MNLIHKKHQKLLLKNGQQLLSSHFGPGSNNLSLLSSTRKQLDEDDEDDMEEEEGLDEREPEKAIFSERYYKVSNKELIEEFKNQVIQLK